MFLEHHWVGVLQGPPMGCDDPPKSLSWGLDRCSVSLAVVGKMLWPHQGKCPPVAMDLGAECLVGSVEV